MKQRQIDLSISETNFNLIWCALHDREAKLLKVIEKYGEESDEAIHAANDLIYLRLYQDSLKQKTEGVFFPSTFLVDDTPV